MKTAQAKKGAIVLRCNSTKGAIIHTGISIERLRACGHTGEVLFIGSTSDLYYYEWGNEGNGHVSLGAYQNALARNLGTTLRTAITQFNIQFNNPHA